MNAKSKIFESLSTAKRTTADSTAGYLINEQGDMCKITEAMIKLACQELKARCHVPSTAKA
jgi:hypothetical protein